MISINYLINLSFSIMIVSATIELKRDIDKARKIKAIISRQIQLRQNPNATLSPLRHAMEYNPELGRAIQLRRMFKGQPPGVSSSIDLPFWMDEWQKFFEKKRKEAKEIYNPQEHDASINMVAARPFGVRCGDPDQYAVLWGNCMMPQQCAAELRIWRGDNFCGRTETVCCAMQINAYDTIQGLPPSFEDSDMGFESSEYDATSAETKLRHAKDIKDKYQKHRIVRKDRLKVAIKNIANKIKTMLKKAYHKITDDKAKQTLLLRKYIKWLKRMHKKDRLSVRDLHELEMIKLDRGLLKKINQLMGISKYANKNDTFREITYNATITNKMASLLLRFFPETKSDFNKLTRRSGAPITADYSESYGLGDFFDMNADQNNANQNNANQTRDKDVEYGILYF